MNRALAAPCYFTDKELKEVYSHPIPHHIAIIPDGNRRWAKNQLVSTEKGHMAGYEGVVKIIKAAKELGVKIVTLYCFSTENWKRPSLENEHLMQLTHSYLASYQQKLVDHNIRLSAIGNIDQLPVGVQTILHETIRCTKACSALDFVLALNYGGRDELVRAVSRIIQENIDHKDITEQTISEHLDTRQWPDPDLVIRTSGEMRLSNFLLWQTSYAEVYFESVAWPDFTPQHLLQAVTDYQRRERRLGGSIL